MVGRAEGPRSAPPGYSAVVGEMSSDVVDAEGTGGATEYGHLDQCMAEDASGGPL